MKKILFFINTLNGGGAEKVLVDLVNNLSPQKFQITVQTFLDAGVYRSSLKEHIRYKTIIRLRNPFLRRIAIKLYMKLIPTKYLYKRFIEDDYDCEVAFLEGFPTRVIGMSGNQKPCRIGWLHTDIINYPDSCSAYTKKFSEKMAYESLDKIACVSEAARENLIKKYKIPKEKTAVIYNIIDDEDVRQKGCREIGEVISRPLLISAGRLTEQKGYDGLLRIHKRLIDDGIDHTLWIVGEGEKRQELEEYIKANRLKTVKLLGFQENPYQYMAKADVFVSSSIVEGFGMVMTESVILGVPVISTNTAAVYEPAEAPRCSVVANNPEQLYEEIRKVLSDENELERLRADVRGKQAFFRKEQFLSKAESFLIDSIEEATENVEGNI